MFETFCKNNSLELKTHPRPTLLFYVGLTNQPITVIDPLEDFKDAPRPSDDTKSPATILKMG